MGIWARFKLRINKFLDNLAKENQELYGSGKMDCCNINRKSNGRK